MQIIKKKEHPGNVLFLIGILLELLVMMAGHSQWTLPFSGRITHIAFVLFGCKILTTYYSKAEWVAIILASGLGMVSYLTCGDEYVIRAVVMVVAAKNIDWNKVLKTIFSVAAVGTAVIVLLALTGGLGELVDIRDYGRGAVEARWCLGFSHANNVHDMFWYLTVLLFLIKREYRWWQYLLLFMADVGLYLLTASRTGFLAVGILIGATALFQYFPKWNESILVYIIGAFALGTCMFFTIMGAMYGKNSPLVAFADRFFNQRLNMCFDHANITQWQLFPEYRSFEKAVDNGFGAFFYQYGIVMGIVVVFLLLFTIFRLYREQNGVVLSMLVTYIFVWFMETTFIVNTSMLCNLFFVLLFERWYRLTERGKNVESI